MLLPTNNIHENNQYSAQKANSMQIRVTFFCTVVNHLESRTAYRGHNPVEVIPEKED